MSLSPSRVHSPLCHHSSPCRHAGWFSVAVCSVLLCRHQELSEWSCSALPHLPNLPLFFATKLCYLLQHLSCVCLFRQKDKASLQVLVAVANFHDTNHVSAGKPARLPRPNQSGPESGPRRPAVAIARPPCLGPSPRPVVVCRPHLPPTPRPPSAHSPARGPGPRPSAVPLPPSARCFPLRQRPPGAAKQQSLFPPMAWLRGSGGIHTTPGKLPPPVRLSPPPPNVGRHLWPVLADLSSDSPCGPPGSHHQFSF